MPRNMRRVGWGSGVWGARGVRVVGGCSFEGMGVFLGGPPQSEECSKFAFELIQISDVASTVQPRHRVDPSLQRIHLHQTAFIT